MPLGRLHREARNHRIAMAAIRVSLVSGELIAVYQGEGQTARTLKLFLASKVKHSRFCQRLLCEDGSELSDDAKLLPFMNLQLVLLQFWCPDSEQAQELTQGNAALQTP